MTVLTNFQIRTIDFITGSNGEVVEVNVRFDSNESNGEYFNGITKLTLAEYESKASIADLTTLVKSKVKSKFSEPTTTGSTI